MSNTPPAQETVTCQELRIVGSDGRLRGLLGCTDDVPYFQLYDSNGRVRLQAQVESSGRPALVLWDERSAPAISIGLHQDEEGTRGITIHGGRGYPVLTVTVNESNEMQIATLPGGHAANDPNSQANC